MEWAKIETRKYITVPIVGENGKDAARRWLWEYLRDNDFVSVNIEQFPDKIVAEVEFSEQKDF